MMTNSDRRQRATALQLHGVLAHWAECADQPWLDSLLEWEEVERKRRSLERRLRCAHIGRFKPLVDFDWAWPTQCDQRAIAELMSLDFLSNATNAILVGASGLGKTMIAQNIAHQAVLNGHTVMFATAGQLLGELAGLDSDSALRYRLRRYAAPDLLVVDEVGYLSYSNRHADLLFELINRRHEKKSTLITTNKAFSEWSEVFPNASCVVAMIDRLVHHADILVIKGESYRRKEAQERAAAKSKKRKPKESS
jgi:DNA replication protein DnaC